MIAPWLLVVVFGTPDHMKVDGTALVLPMHTREACLDAAKELQEYWHKPPILWLHTNCLATGMKVKQ